MSSTRGAMQRSVRVSHLRCSTPAIKVFTYCIEWAVPSNPSFADAVSKKEKTLELELDHA
jgi:hypothetical protein